MIVVEGKRARGWLHRVSGCTAQREPLTAEVGVGLQEYDYDLFAGVCVFNLHQTRRRWRQRAGQRADERAGASNNRNKITNCDTSSFDTAAQQGLQALIVPAGSRQRG